MKNYLLYIFITLFFLGCGRNIPTPIERLNSAQKLAFNYELEQETFSTNSFDIFSYKKTNMCKNKMKVYIEGDGFAWKTSYVVSDDPTPINPLALKLMSKDNSNCKIYLARACQYKQNSLCKKRYWTSHRFSKKIIDSYIDVLDRVKSKYHIKEFELIGFSGGGAIATLLGGYRDDINHIVTVAGNIDTEYWIKKHRLTPMIGSLNPANFTDRLSHIKQFHLIGNDDNNIDKSIFDSYLSKFEDKSNVEFKVYKNFTHTKGWVENWEKILKEIE